MIIFYCCKMKKKIFVICFGFDFFYLKKVFMWLEFVKRKIIMIVLLLIQILFLVCKMFKKIEIEWKLKVCWDNG